MYTTKEADVRADPNPECTNRDGSRRFKIATLRISRSHRCPGVRVRPFAYWRLWALLTRMRPHPDCRRTTGRLVERISGPINDPMVRIGGTTSLSQAAMGTRFLSVAAAMLPTEA